MKLKTTILCGYAALLFSVSSAQTVLPDLGAGGAAEAINDQGQVVGVVYDPNTYLAKPARWTNGSLAVLATGTFEDAQPLSISPNGKFVVGKGGDVFTTPAGNPVIWDQAGSIQTLPHLGFGGIATSVNDSGVAVGYVYDFDNTWRAARWTADGNLELLPAASSERFSGAFDINSTGHIAGFAYTEPFYEASVKWSIGAPTFLEDATWNFGRAIALAENNTSLVLSTRRTEFIQTWFTVRENGERTTLQPLEPSLHFTAKDINAAENVVGYGSAPNESDSIRIRAAVWIGGVPTVLPVPNESTYSIAGGISETGAVAGTLFDSDGTFSLPATWEPVAGAGAQLRLSPIKARPGQTVRLRATFTMGGKPKAGMTVKFMTAGHATLGTAQTNANGIAEILHAIPRTAQPGVSVYRAAMGGTRTWHGTFEIVADSASKPRPQPR